MNCHVCGKKILDAWEGYSVPREFNCFNCVMWAEDIFTAARLAPRASSRPLEQTNRPKQVSRPREEALRRSQSFLERNRRIPTRKPPPAREALKQSREKKFARRWGGNSSRDEALALEGAGGLEAETTAPE